MSASSIPLHCNICPKKPNFSDVSHLLTHIASKGHLSNYYKLKVRSSIDDEATESIDDYDQWYADWRVEELMSDRMSQKDRRRTRARPAGRATPAPAKVEAPAPRPARPRAAVGNLLDPRLAEQQQVKVEHSLTPASTPQPGPSLRPRPFAARMQYWPAGSRSTSQSYTNPEYDTSSEYSEPMARNRFRYSVEDSCAVEDDAADAAPPATEDPMAVSESTRLKGVYWPGMDIFDSATPEMRRKRNQKKDSSVVEQLELNSQDVEATELIFTPQGSFKRQRRISSSVIDDEEDSPLGAESPRPFLSRPALADMDPNASRRPRQLTRPLPFTLLGRAQYESDRRMDYGFSNEVSRKKRAFEVYNDDELPFGQPAPLNYLTASYHPHQASPSPAPAFPAYKAYTNGYQYQGKENDMSVHHQPMFSHHQRHPSGYHYHATYAYGLGQDQHAFQYQGNLYANTAYQRAQEDADDQRTLTAPPSPSTA